MSSGFDSFRSERNGVVSPGGTGRVFGYTVEGSVALIGYIVNEKGAFLRFRIGFNGVVLNQFLTVKFPGYGSLRLGFDLEFKIVTISK